ncbi:hypothetical protein SmJEL517_g01189 [Synchytrium microbalum]|uniref:Uncharacterized protein n=1 Tax=Synchytrium microbalum TaxID=1806994 RepID=A0A507CGB2_9FUNG|nr:uncharacterized protein SmJEL517_g01189 [Synchytrium microbalum]TPX36523.1 hypothetical protein SmJEL517_g01189 [Synchytrium microbalum]
MSLAIKRSQSYQILYSSTRYIALRDAARHYSSPTPAPVNKLPLLPPSLTSKPLPKLGVAKLTARLDEKLKLDVAAQLDEKKGYHDGLLKRLEKRIDEEHKKLLEQESQRKEILKTSRRISPKIQKQMEEFLDSKNNMRDREALYEEAFKEGYWENTKEMIRQGDKLWEASKTAIPTIDAKLFPNWDGIDLNNKPTNVKTILDGKLSLVCFMMSGLAEKHITTYLDPFRKEFAQDTRVKTILLNIEENPVRGTAAKWMVVPFIRWKTAKTERGNYMLHFGPVDRQSIGISNRHLGWVQLVDTFGRIRWQAHGPAKPDEVATLLQLTREFMDASQ